MTTAKPLKLNQLTMNVQETQVGRKHIKQMFVNTKHKCAKIFHKWDIALIELNVNLLMVVNSFINRVLLQKKHTGLKNANHFGKKVSAVTVSDASFSIINQELRAKKISSKQLATCFVIPHRKARVD